MNEIVCLHLSLTFYSLPQFASKVVLCEKAELKRKNAENKEECLSGYNVVLEDTILFPEGGGQVRSSSYSFSHSPVIVFTFQVQFIRFHSHATTV